ncbi:ankyrin repeat domain-containing RING finger protein [Cardinium endosymbiont of Nabis limbatus]|uniref:ankyrin repeat domain-containing RING finger protein n=1 Tax=Cardinium endosymbiont of Nabis limbatus TaxID=3066217 RepID=UPI003AF35188
MCKKVKIYIKVIVFSKLASVLISSLSLVLTTGCNKADWKYGEDEKPTYSSGMLHNDSHNIIHFKSDEKPDLHIAVKQGDTNRVKSLLNDPMVNVDQKDSDDNTPLHIAVRLGLLKIVEVLLSAPKIDVNATNFHDEKAIYIAYDTGNEEVLALLLKDEKIECNRSCSICLGDDICMNDLHITSCSHLFHKTCHKQWNDSQLNDKICPNCRKKIKPV